MLSKILVILSAVSFTVIVSLLTYAEASIGGSNKPPREIAKFKTAARAIIALVWLILGILAMLLPYALGLRIVIVAVSTLVTLVSMQVARGLAVASLARQLPSGKIARAFVRLLMLLTAPLLLFVSAVSNFLLRKFGVDTAALYTSVSEEEILRMVRVGGEAGSIDTTEQEMIDNVFAFDDTSVQDVCTHRTDIEAIDVTATSEEIIKTIMDTKFSRYPVYEEHIDNIVGVVHVKDILRHVFTRSDVLSDFILRNHVTAPYYAPQSMKIDELFQELSLAKAAHLAIVVDEYGGTYGLATVEDLVESIVGQIYDETDDVEVPDFQQIGEGRYMIMGMADLAETAEMLEIDIVIGDFETIGGYLVHLLERVPDDGETPSVSHMGYDFHVREVKERRIHSLVAERVVAEEG